MRIYTPDRELPFAGHPTIGAAVALARESIADGLSTGLVLMEEKIGLIRAAVRVDGEQSDRDGGFAEFDLVTKPTEKEWTPDKDDVALALGLAPQQIGFENHVPTDFDGGMPYFCVPVHDLEALNSVQPNGPLFAQLFAGGRGHDSVYMYTRETVGADSAFAARMMWPVGGAVRESGNRVGRVVARWCYRQVRCTDGRTPSVGDRAGLRHGPASQIELELEMDAAGDLSAARLGGNAVCVAEGTLSL